MLTRVHEALARQVGRTGESSEHIVSDFVSRGRKRILTVRIGNRRLPLDIKETGETRE